MGAKTYCSSAEEMNSLREEFRSNPAIREIQTFAAEHRQEAAELREQKPFQDLADSTATVTDAILSPLQKSKDSTGQMVTGITGLSIEEFQETAQSQPDAIIKANLTQGDSTMTAWLKSDQPQMTSANRTDADYGVLSQLTYASKNLVMAHSSDQEWLNQNQELLASYKQVVSKEHVTISEYCQGLLDVGGDEMDPIDRVFLEQLKDSSRYGNLTIDHVAGDDSGSRGVNSIVMAIGTGDGHGVIAVQGTDGRTEDWKENGKFVGTNPSEEEQWVTSVSNVWASEYESIDLTGHSQGGREAVTAAVFMDPENQAKINRVVNNDGPGYSESFINLHSDKMAQIADKIDNYLPYPRSFVGTLLNHVGQDHDIVALQDTVVTKVGPDGKVEYTNQHVSTTWPINIGTGSYLQADIETVDYVNVIENAIGGAAEVLKVIMGDEAVRELASAIFALGDNGNGLLEFDQFIKTDSIEGFAESVSKIENLLSKAKDNFETGLANIREKNLYDGEQCLYVIADTLDEAIDEVNEILGEIVMGLEILTVLCPEAVEVTGPILAVIEEVQKVLAVVEKVCQAIMIVLNVVAYFREKEKKQAREEYLSVNEEINVSETVLDSAMAYLNEASRALDNALGYFITTMKSYQNKIIEMIADAVGVETEKITIEVLDYARGCLYTGLDPGVLNDSDNIRNAASAIDEVVNDMNHILADIKDPNFTVNPGQLKNAGVEGTSTMEMIQKQMTSSTDEMETAFSSWVGPDKEALKAKVTACDAADEELIDALKSMFGDLESIAAAYSQFQKNAIERFQYARL